MRFSDGQGRYYILTADEWVFTGTRMEPVTETLSSLWLRSDIAYPERHPALGTPNKAYGELQTHVLVPVGFADNDDSAGGVIVQTIPGPPATTCCELVADGGQGVCATEVKVKVNVT